MSEKKEQTEAKKEAGSNEGGRRQVRRRRRRGGNRNRPGRECDFVDFKDIETLRKNCTQQWKIQSRKRNGTCSKCQSMIKLAVKRARFMALIPYVG